AGWTDDEPARKLPAGRAKRVNPPLTAIISDESLYESTGFFLFIISQSGGRKLPFPTIKSLGIDGNGMLNPQISSGSSEFSQANKMQQHIVAHL
ncbi:hypothetical protein, partial [Phytobacter diazotrophicus]|uniref:hypothetical protein n=1 Tax=Phytobacter diazotrophicus TaxID=395631 RepID=UPI002FF6B63D